MLPDSNKTVSGKPGAVHPLFLERYFGIRKTLYSKLLDTLEENRRLLFEVKLKPDLINNTHFCNLVYCNLCEHLFMLRLLQKTSTDASIHLQSLEDDPTYITDPNGFFMEEIRRVSLQNEDTQKT